VGDYYYHGLGVPDEPEQARWEKAAGYYQSAADTQMSALAMWNLGWMYENGVGVPQDFHLAKRHYDLAYETNSEAYLPVVMSLVKLHARSVWHTLMGGSNGLSIWGDDSDEGSDSHYTSSEGREIEGGSDRENDRSPPGEQAEEREDYEDGPWYLGKARDEFNRRRRGRDMDQLGQDEDDPVQWARERRQAENDRDGDYGPEDYFDAATRGQHRDEEEVDDFAETMLLVVLCLVVSVLLYVRGRWMERMRRDEQQQQQQQQQQPHQAQQQPLGAPGQQPPLADGPMPPVAVPMMDDWEMALLNQ